MRVCLPHLEPAVTTLKDLRDNTEYDLCQKCIDRVIPIMNVEKQPGRPKKEDKT
jgi:hypothetical protein